ncbi:F0F1 ATP synthase subunit delta [Amycolatopsis sp.]|jgi:F-type H+-transporting ATPase subunit delta|uniref:F0F1 ATP synthase subunit delta n=1 Tax=Amycolatopsis sp. TaxID=37632 RepID=UPI002DFBCCCF|nr:F0F1 ATP synthase subunit delta [Amycolatopsis sp.]
MTLHAASRESLALAETRLGEVLSDAGTDPATVGVELLSVVELLGREVGLRRAVSDASAEPEARQRLVRSLLEGKISEPALKVLDSVATNRWSSPREMLDGIEAAGRSALLTSAEKTGNLDTVESQLFRTARIIAGEPELERALADQAAPIEAKRKLVRGLFADRLDVVTETLVEQAILRHQGRGIGVGLDELVELAAQRRDRSVARVTSASELSAEQHALLSEKLNRIYGRQIAVHIEIDPGLGGGLVIRVGDEVIDGSAAGRIAELRRQLA